MQPQIITASYYNSNSPLQFIVLKIFPETAFDP